MSVWGQVTEDAESAGLHVGSEPVAEPPDATANNPIADFAVIPLGQLHKYTALSVRLKNALSQAEQLGVLPFKTLGDYVDAGDRAQFQMRMWVPNLGAKSASELALVAATLKFRGIPAPVVDSFDQEALCLALTKLFIEVDATSALAAQGIPVRLATALDLAGLRDKSLAAVLPRLDYLNHEIPRLPNVGAQSRAAWTRSLSGALEAHLRKLEFDAIDAALARDLLVRNISPPADAAERMFLQLEAIERGEVQPPPPPAPEELVTRLITRLMDREQEFLSRRFGLDGGGVQTLEEIGRDHNITRERVRQIEAKAIRKLKQYGRIELTEAIMAAGARLWRYALGDQSAIATRSIGAAEARLPPLLTLALEVCNLKLAQLLPVIAAAVPGGFVDRETDLPALDRVRALLDRRLATQPLPIALPELIELGHYDLAMIVVALDPRRRAYWSYIVEGFVGARTRRAVWLHQILRGAGEPLEIVDLVERFNRAGIEAACGVRDAHIVMERWPQLFVEVFDGTWMGLGETPGIVVDAATNAPVLAPALDQEADDIDEIEDGDAEVQATTNRDALEAELRRRGPCRGSDLMDRFAEILPEGRAATSVGPTLISHKDVFTRLLPGIYALEDQIPTAQTILDDPPAYLLDESQARTYAFGRRSGELWGAFVLWTPEAEYALCRWAKRHADTPLLESLLSVASIEAWPIDEGEKETWRAFAAERGRFVIGFEALTSSWILPELDEVLSAALLLRRQGHLGWIKANRVLNRRVIDHVSVGLLAVLVALGAATPSENWQTPQGTGPGLETLIARLQAQRIRSGRLDWAAGPGPELVRQALDARADVLGWVDPERLVGLFVALEPAPAPEAQPSSPLDRLLRQRAERLRASQSAATLASLQSFDNPVDDA